MLHSLLIITPQPSFGEYIHQSLKESSLTYVEIVDNGVAALYKMETRKFTHAFLDTDIENEAILDLGLALRRKDPNLRLIIISPRQSMPRYDELRPWSFLGKPFFAPDLLRILDEKLSPSLSFSGIKKHQEKIKTAVDENGGIFWLEDVNKTAQHLTRLTLESSAQATLIIRNEKMWAYAGQLSDMASAELVQIVSRDKKAGDLLKFLRLKATQAEHMLYATELADEIALVMVFDAETPFSAIRRQATHLAESLAFSLQEASKKVPELPPESPAQEEYSPQEKEKKALIDLFEFDDEEDNNLPPISEILENIPVPNPVSAASEVRTSAPVSTPSPEVAQSSVFDEPMPNPFANARAEIARREGVVASQEGSPAIRSDDYFERKSQIDIELAETRVQEAQHAQMQVDLAETRVQEAQSRESLEQDLNATRLSKPARRVTPVSKPRPEELIETRLNAISNVSVFEQRPLEPVSSGMYDLTYACLLVPRFNTHHLTGDLSEKLSSWMPNICVAFGWRLEYLSVRPDYLQWVVNVPPTTSPGYLMRIMRKQTSEKIFRDFPRNVDDNPSGDFWAPGYLIMGGSQPHPSKLVEDYIQRTRQRQGTRQLKRDS